MTLATDSADTWKIAVALSGGGHRASLFNLGVLMALVDLRLNRQVSYVASVSGGSITNAFIGLQCEFDKETPDSFDEVARKLVSVIVNRGIVTERLICAVVLLLVLPSALFVGALIFGMVEPTFRNGLLLTAIVFISLTCALFRGLIVERLLARRLFSNANGQLRFKDFKSKNVEHVLCCTELASGRPIYFSSAAGGRILIRLAEDERTASLGQSHLIKSCSELPVAAAVRASAAFPPGISPRRLSIRSLTDAEPAGLARSQPPNGAVVWPLFLSDGGVWNNLATQALVEDSILKGSNAAFFKPEVVLVANASAAFKSVRSWPFHVPGRAEWEALMQAIWIQNRNTVEPRLASLRDRLLYRLKNDIGPHSADPFIVPIDLAKSVAETTADYRTDTMADVFSERSSKFREWTKVLVSKLSDWKAKADQAPNPSDATKLYELIREQFIYKPATYATDTESIRKITDNYRVFEGDLTQCDLPKIRTTLDRIPKDDAIALLARGYANTHAVAYCMNLVDSAEIKMTRERLMRLTSSSEAS